MGKVPSSALTLESPIGVYHNEHSSTLTLESLVGDYRDEHSSALTLESPIGDYHYKHSSALTLESLVGDCHGKHTSIILRLEGLVLSKWSCHGLLFPKHQGRQVGTEQMLALKPDAETHLNHLTGLADCNPI